MADLDTLRPEVREAVQELDGKAYPGSRTHEHWLTIRAELLRLSDECATLKAQSIYPRAQLLGNLADANERAEKAEAELVALKTRIAEAPVVTINDSGRIIGDGYVPSLRGKHARLVVEG